MADNTKGMMNFVPGMDFVQNLFKAAPNIAQSLPPSLAQWITPTTSVEEIDKKITDLKAVQSWLETNTSMLKATVQALEVQRMTISTLKSMKLNLTDVPGYAFDKAKGAAKEAVSDIKEAPLDPMQWWGALSKQMTQPFAALDPKAMQEAAKQATKSMAKTAASATASSLAAGAVDAAFGMADKSFKAAGNLAKSALGAQKNSNTPKKTTSVAKKNARKSTATRRSISKP